MARLVVRTVDKVPSSDPRYLLFLRAGEVVEVLEDGQSLGSEGDKNPDWKVIDMPKVSMSEARTMLARRNVEKDSGKLPLLREFKLGDADALKTEEQDATYATLSTNAVRYADVQDPDVIGPADGVIG